ncbi:MAG: hypothetical protein WAK16_00125 [Candidatus Cybelea sp.]
MKKRQPTPSGSIAVDLNEGAKEQRGCDGGEQGAGQADAERAARVLLATDLREADHAQAEPALRSEAETECQERPEPRRRSGTDGREGPGQECDEDANHGERQRAASAEEIVAQRAPREPAADRPDLRKRKKPQR